MVKTFFHDCVIITQSQKNDGGGKFLLGFKHVAKGNKAIFIDNWRVSLKFFKNERDTRIELAPLAWEASVLPLYESRLICPPLVPPSIENRK